MTDPNNDYRVYLHKSEYKATRIAEGYNAMFMNMAREFYPKLVEAAEQNPGVESVAFTFKFKSPEGVETEVTVSFAPGKEK